MWPYVLRRYILIKGFASYLAQTTHTYRKPVVCIAAYSKVLCQRLGYTQH